MLSKEKDIDECKDKKRPKVTKLVGGNAQNAEETSTKHDHAE